MTKKTKKKAARKPKKTKKKAARKPKKTKPTKSHQKAHVKPPTKRPPPTPEAIAKKQYVTNPIFYKEMIKCQREGKMSNELGKMFMLVSAHYCSKPNFSGYSYKDEMIACGIKACCEAFDKFNPRKSKNPFAFFTMVIHNSFLQVLNKEKRQQRIRDKILIENEMDPSRSYTEDHSEESGFDDREEVVVAKPDHLGFNTGDKPTTPEITPKKQTHA